MPPTQAVGREELPPAWAREAEDVLEIRGRRRQRPGDCRVQRSAYSRKCDNGRDAGTDLEAAVGDVLVGHQVAEEV
jgi:hypothetical protein